MNQNDRKAVQNDQNADQYISHRSGTASSDGKEGDRRLKENTKFSTANPTICPRSGRR